MTRAWPYFEANAERARSLVGLYEAHRALFSPVLNSDDMLRSALAAIVSALDAYVHQRCKQGLIETFLGIRSEAQGFRLFQLSASTFMSYVTSGMQLAALESAIHEKLGWQSFQMPDKIADAWRLISDVKVWHEVAVELGMSPPDVKVKLKLIVDRRNSIVHEGDMRPDRVGELWPIDSVEVSGNIDFIVMIVRGLEKL
jgi:hypothetical protein